MNVRGGLLLLATLIFLYLLIVLKYVWLGSALLILPRLLEAKRQGLGKASLLTWYGYAAVIALWFRLPQASFKLPSLGTGNSELIYTAEKLLVFSIITAMEMNPQPPLWMFLQNKHFNAHLSC